MTDALARKCRKQLRASFSLALFPLQRISTKGTRTMAKSVDSMFEMIRSSKHPFRQVADRPDKPQKSRYERRKVKQFLHMGGDWAEQPQT
jgi:hypothetical protein